MFDCDWNFCSKIFCFLVGFLANVEACARDQCRRIALVVVVVVVVVVVALIRNM